MTLQPLVVLQFDRALARSSVARANYTIASGSNKDLDFKQIRVDPVDRTVVFTLETPLLPSTDYKLIVRAADREADRLAAYDGTPFEGTYTISFSTASSAGAVETDIDPVAVDACHTVTTLQATCFGSACHGDRDSAGPPAMGLSFASSAAVQATAVGKAASEVQIAAAPRTGSPNAPFPYGMQLVAPNESAASFLLYKILMDPRLRDEGLDPDQPYPPLSIASAPLTPRRLQQLGQELSKVIPGAPMPHPDLVPDPSAEPYKPLGLKEVRLLRAWIDRGAPPCLAPGADAGSPDGSPEGGSDAMDASSEAATDASGGG